MKRRIEKASEGEKERESNHNSGFLQHYVVTYTIQMALVVFLCVFMCRMNSLFFGHTCVCTVHTLYVPACVSNKCNCCSHINAINTTNTLCGVNGRARTRDAKPI